MKNIFLTSCGIINNEIKKEFYNVITKDVKDIKVLYITTASDGEADSDKTWMEEEFQTILDLGILKENITEHKIGNEININEFDVMYMMGGNTFYLLNIIRKTGFDKNIKEFINSGKIYVGSSAGSEILGNSIDVALGYDDNNVIIIETGVEHAKSDMNYAVFQGIMTITNVNKFRELMLNGIGRNKAFGMGLITIAPITR